MSRAARPAGACAVVWSVRRRFLLAAMAVVAPHVLSADEVWSTELGDVVHLRDIGDMAVLSVPLDEVTGLIYLPGLAGAGAGAVAGPLVGFWISDEVGPCPAELRSPEGLLSDSWGKVVYAPGGADRPGDWTMHVGACFDEPHVTLNGRRR